MLGQTPKRSFQTRPAQRITDTAPAAQPAASGQAQPPTAPAAAASPGVEGPTAGRGATPPAADSAAGAAPGAPPAPEASPDAQKPPEKITAADESQRIARIHRAETRHQEQVARDRTEIQQARDALERERSSHGENLRRVQMLDQVRQKPPAAWLPFLQEVFGVAPKVLIDELIGHQNRKPEELAHERFQSELARRDQQLAELSRAVQDSAKAQEQARATEALQKFKAEQIAPVLADRAKFELTHRALGDKAADEVYSLQKARYDIVNAGKSGKAIAGLTAAQAAALPLLTPLQAAEMIESHLRKQRDTLSGTSATPAKPPEPTNTVEPPLATASGSQAQKPPAPKSPAWRPPPKPYNRKILR